MVGNRIGVDYMEKTTIVIVVEDGMIQDVLASNRNIEVEVLDMDFAEDYDEYEIKQDKWTELREKMNVVY